MRSITDPARRTFLVSSVVLVIAVNAGRAEHPIAVAQRLQQSANEACHEGDYPGFTQALEQALELNPSSHVTRYNLACGDARIGQIDFVGQGPAPATRPSQFPEPLAPFLGKTIIKNRPLPFSATGHHRGER